MTHYTANSLVLQPSGEPLSFAVYIQEVESLLRDIVHGHTQAVVQALDAPTRSYLAWRWLHGQNSLSHDQFEALCRDIDGRSDPSELLAAQVAPLFDSDRSGLISALPAQDRNIADLGSLPQDQLTYIDKIHLLISERVHNDHRVHQGLPHPGAAEGETLISVLTLLAGTELTKLESRRLDREKADARKLLSRLAASPKEQTQAQLVLF